MMMMMRRSPDDDDDDDEKKHRLAYTHIKSIEIDTHVAERDAC